MMLACSTIVQALLFPQEVTIRELFVEYEWKDAETLGNLVQLNSILAHYGLQCLPAIGNFDIDHPRVLRKLPGPGNLEIIKQEIAEGEGPSIELKSSLLFDHQKHHFNPGLMPSEYKSTTVIFSALKTICAFLNTEGGALHVGVKDDGTILGVNRDFDLLGNDFHGIDGWELHLRDLVQKNFIDGQSVNSYISLTTASQNDLICCRLQIAKRKQVSFLKKENGFELYIRSGNRSIPVALTDIEKFYELRKLF